jgi:hypothetical protein
MKQWDMPTTPAGAERARQPAFCRSMTRFLAVCVTHDAVEWTVAPRMRTRRVACSITDRTYIRGAGQGDGFEEVGGENGLGLGAQERRPGGGTALGCGVDAGVAEDLAHG